MESEGSTSRVIVLPVRVFTNICMVQNNYQNQIIIRLSSPAQPSFADPLPSLKTRPPFVPPLQQIQLFAMSKDFLARPTLDDSFYLSSDLKRLASSHNNHPFNNQDRKLNSSSSMRTLSHNEESQVIALQKENQILRKEVERLKKELIRSPSLSHPHPIQLQQEVKRLKGIIQKSFYSMKSMEKEAQILRGQRDALKQSLAAAQARVMSLEKKEIALLNSLRILKQNHHSEINLVWQRVSHLQRNLEAVVVLVGTDRKQSGRAAGQKKDLTNSVDVKRERFFGQQGLQE